MRRGLIHPARDLGRVFVVFVSYVSVGERRKLGPVYGKCVVAGLSV